MRAKQTFRVAVALAVTAAVSSIGVQTAAAVSGSITSYTTPVSLTFEGGKTVGAALITLRTVDSDELLTYCIDLNTHTGTGVTYDEGSWTQANVPDVAKVTAILQASYPVRTLVQLRQSSNIATLTQQEAIAGTQATIWHFTDLVNLDRTVAAQDSSSNIGALYDHLLGVASNPVVEPVPALSISPLTASATVGTSVGPFTLHVNPATAVVTVSNDSGAVFTDADGNSIVPTADGQVFWVTPAVEGSFHINATAEVAVPTGRVFLHTATDADPSAHQKLVLAKSSDVTTNATASFDSTPVPTTTTEAPTTTQAPNTTEGTVTSEAPTTVVSTTAISTDPEPTTAELGLVDALPPVPVATTSTVPVAATLTPVSLPVTGSSSTTPTLVLAAGSLLLGIAIIAATRRHRTLH